MSTKSVTAAAFCAGMSDCARCLTFRATVSWRHESLAILFWVVYGDSGFTAWGCCDGAAHLMKWPGRRATGRQSAILALTAGLGPCNATRLPRSLMTARPGCPRIATVSPVLMGCGPWRCRWPADGLCCRCWRGSFCCSRKGFTTGVPCLSTLDFCFERPLLGRSCSTQLVSCSMALRLSPCSAAS